MHDLGLKGDRHHGGAELEGAVVREDQVAQLQQLRRAERRVAERGEPLLEHQQAQYHVAHEGVRRGEGKTARPNGVRLELADVVQQGAGEGEVGVGAHRRRHGVGEDGDLGDVLQQPAHGCVVRVDARGPALEALTEGVVGEEEVHHPTQ